MKIGKKVLSLMLLGFSLNMVGVHSSEASSKTTKTSKVSSKKAVKTTKLTVTTNKKIKTVNTKKENSSTKRVKYVISSKKEQHITKTKSVYHPPSNVIYSIYDLNSSQYLEQQKINSPHSIASLTKLMTSYVFLKETPSLNNCEMSITDEDKDLVKKTRTHLPKYESISCKKILDATLALSDNYAASSIARHTGTLSKPEFIAKMNAQARAWGMNNTFFADSSGLNPENKSTANDLTKFLSKIVKTKEFELMEEASTSKEVLLTHTGIPKSYGNTNKLIREEIFDAQLSKTGYISESGYNLMFIPQECDDNKKLALVIMGEKSSWNRSSLATKLLKKYNCR